MSATHQLGPNIVRTLLYRNRKKEERSKCGAMAMEEILLKNKGASEEENRSVDNGVSERRKHSFSNQYHRPELRLWEWDVARSGNCQSLTRATIW